MDGYFLQPNEVVLFKADDVISSVVPKGKTKLILTNLYLVYIYKVKIGFRKYDTITEKKSIETLKIYNEKPQVKQHGSEVEIYFVDSNHNLTFDSFFTAKKFVKNIYELASGKTVIKRGADKVKSGINLVDETLGLDTVDTVKGVLQKGVVGTVIGGIGHRHAKSKKVQFAEEMAEMFVNQTPSNTIEVEEVHNKDACLSFDEQIEAVKKLKTLLDEGVLTQEEFDMKKKEIMGL